MDLLRRYVPKYFFKCVNRQLSFNQGQPLMLSFKSRVVDGAITPEASLPEYLGQLYTDQDLALERISRTHYDIEDEISEAELEISRQKLSRHKAVGIDLLKDMIFHDDVLWDTVKSKVLAKFNEWVLTLRIPSYLKLAKIIPLSKDPDGSPYPSLGQVRTIAVTPAISKLFELCILQKIRDQIDEKKLLHPNQRGFVPGKSCEDNLVDLTEIIQQAKDVEQAYRAARTRNRNRVKTFVLFIDLKKAFDKVPRRNLIVKLLNSGMPTSLIQTIHAMLQGTRAQVGNDIINMDVGVPQGAVLSPTLFALYINDLIVELNSNNKCYAFADDLVVVAEGEFQLHQVIQITERWSERNGIEVNKAKSGIIQVRKDRRTPSPM